MNESAATPKSNLMEAIRDNASSAVMSGIILIIAGVLALASPLIAGLSITLMVGALLTVGGISQAFLAFKAGAFGRGLLVFVVGLFMALTGLYMMSQPVAGLASLTLLLAVYLIASGLAEVMVAFQMRPAQGWGWELFNAIVTFLLGLMLWRQYPLSGVWAIGVLFGIKLLFTGWTLFLIGRTVNKVAGDTEVSP